MAVFGWRTARQRMRRATEQALSVPTFRATMDCTPWVLGGLWPAELHQVTPETAQVAEYLKNDLQRIADSANDRLRGIARAGLEEQVRQAEESRIINVARAFAVLRVESTVRQIRKEPLGYQSELASLAEQPGEPRPADTVERRRPDTRAIDVEPEPEVEREPAATVRPEPEPETPKFFEPAPEPEVPKFMAPEPEPEAQPSLEPEPAFEPEPEPEPVPAPAVETPAAPRWWPDSEPDLIVEPDPEPAPMFRRPAEPAQAATALESEQARLTRVLRFVARQEPGLRWAIGRRAGGAVVLTTDLAHGWIPPGLKLPAEAELLAPQRRSGSPTAMLGDTEEVVGYAPGDSFGGFTTETSATSTEPWRLPAVTDLEHQLAEVTRGRAGLPRLTHALAAAVAAGDSVVAAEVDVLRVHLDTARYQLMAHYPDLDNALLLNCLLLAATEAVASGDQQAANYHFAWFAGLGGLPGGGRHETA